MPGEFMGLRSKCCLAIGAPVLLITNKVYGAETLLLVLMGGARWAAVGIYRGKGGASPYLPELVVVDVPGYKGDPVFPGEGAEKRAPIPPTTAHGETRKNISRTSIPLISPWSINITRSQGLTRCDALVNL